jgi:iron uptake system component EfeO
MPAALRRSALAALTAASLISLAACGSDSSGSDAKESTKPSDSGVGRVGVTLTGNSCKLDRDSAKAGPVAFTVTNKDAAGITEVELMSDQKIIAEKENLAPGLSPVSFTSTLGGGKYQVYCPGATKELVDFTVTGEGSAAPTGTAAQLLQQGTDGYGKYVTEQVGAMVVSVAKLQQEIDSGDLAAAQKQYGEARPFYEKIESDVDGFVLPGFKATDNHGNLDYLVDMRGSNLDPAVGWHGFHAVERDIFGHRKITPSTKKLAAELTTNVNKLAQLSKSLTYKPEDLANGAAGLLEEVQSNKVSGEEEAFSHIDLVDFAGNVEGAQQAFAYLKPGLTKLDSSLTDTISQRFDAVNTMLNTYRDPAAIGGYKIYTAQLKKTDANKLSQTVQALQDSLANLAEKVATAK